MRGRYPAEVEYYVEQAEGSAEAKRRTRSIWKTFAGCRIQEACRDLNLSRQRVEQLRADLVQQAVSAMEPKPGGRPPAPATVQEAVAALETQLAQTKKELQAARIREEIALVLPHVQPQSAELEKKTPAPTRRRARPG